MKKEEGFSFTTHISINPILKQTESPAHRQAQHHRHKYCKRVSSIIRMKKIKSLTF